MRSGSGTSRPPSQGKPEIVARVLEADVLDQPARAASRSSGTRPRRTSSPSRLQSRRRKYSWREYDRKLRESVSMPTKRDSRPMFESACDLLLHAVELIEEPPGAAVLHLARHRAVLEVADHRREQLVVARVQVVEDRLGQLVGLVEAGRGSAPAAAPREVADGVEAGVRAERRRAAACCCCAARRGGTAAPSRARGPSARSRGAGPTAAQRVAPASSALARARRVEDRRRPRRPCSGSA